MSSINSVLDDFYGCFKNSHIWLILSLSDIKMRYRRTIIGPFWLTLGTTITILGLGAVSSSLFGMKIQSFLPYITVGMIVWIFVSSILNESCTIFISQAAIIHNVKISYFIHVMTTISRNLIIMFHNMLVLIVVFIICEQHVNFEILWVFPGLALLLLNSFWVCVVIGVFATRYRDIASLIGNITTLIMFVTPIMWKPEMLKGNRQFIAELNPFAHMISLIRDPLLGPPPSLESYFIISGIFFVGFPFSLWLYKKYVNRIVFWM